jgi:hypothetical protein
VAAWLVVRSLSWPLIHDAPLMHYVAWRIGEGAVPYRDLFDMNFPARISCTSVSCGSSVRATWPGACSTWGWLAATALVVFAFARAWGVVAGAGGALVFAAYHVGQGAWQTGQRDFLLVFFLVAGALGVARWRSECDRTTALRAVARSSWSPGSRSAPASRSSPTRCCSRSRWAGWWR